MDTFRARPNIGHVCICNNKFPILTGLKKLRYWQKLKNKKYARNVMLKFYFLFKYGWFIYVFNTQILQFLQANEEDRPITIRTNTLKTKRRDLAQVQCSPSNT